MSDDDHQPDSSAQQRPVWQLERLRKTLKFQKDSAEFLDGKPLTWRGLCEAVLEMTGVDVPHERVRQFVEGVVDARTGQRAYPVPRPDRIEAIITFVTDPEDPWIDRDVLERPDFEIAPPACLLDLLTEPSHLPFTKKIAGTFRARREDGARSHEIVLQLEGSFLHSMLQVQEVELCESPPPEAGGLPPAPVLIRTEGWGIITAEDQLLVMMRNPKTGTGHRWLQVGYADYWTEEPVSELVMLRQDYPFDLELGAGAPAPEAQISEQMASHILTFTREGDEHGE